MGQFMNIKDVKTAVLMGGIGSERQISLQSGKCIADALKKAGVNVITSDINPEDLSILDDESIDLFFLALHGKFGEDGQLQEILEEKGLCYTGSDPDASKLAFNKMKSKAAFQKTGIKIPRAIEYTYDFGKQNLRTKLTEISDKFVVKPIEQGSSVGIEIVNGIGETIKKAENCLAEFGDCMIEEFIEGMELTVGILFGNPLPIIEIKSNNKFYDFHAKYEDENTGFYFDTIKENDLAERIKKTGLACFESLGCSDYSRVDLIMNDNNDIYPLEVNTLPGFTSHSLLPMAAKKAGMDMPELCIKIAKNALNKRNQSG